MQNVEMLAVVRAIADAEATRHFKTERVIGLSAMKSMYMAIYGQCYLALLDKGLDDMTILSLDMPTIIHLSMEMVGWKLPDGGA